MHASEHVPIYFVYDKTTVYFTNYYMTCKLSIYFRLPPVWSGHMLLFGQGGSDNYLNLPRNEQRPPL